MVVTVDDLLERSFLSRPFSDIQKILAAGRPRPVLNMEHALTENEHLMLLPFEPTIYDKIHWLTGCEERQKFFCWPCLLFQTAELYSKTEIDISKRHFRAMASTYFSPEFLNIEPPPVSPYYKLWTSTGIFNNFLFTRAKAEHEKSMEHKRACVMLQRYVGKFIITRPLWSSDFFDLKKTMFKTLVKVVRDCLIGQQPLYKRDNGCQLCLENCLKNLSQWRNYRYCCIEETIKLLNILPNTINDLVDAISMVMKNEIKNEIQSSYYASLIITEHSKSTNISQISVIIRYIQDVKVCDRFIRFINVSKTDFVYAMYNHILDIVEDFEITKKFVALSIDEGILSAVDLFLLIRKLKYYYPYLLFIPRYGYNVNHALQHTLSSINICNIFFQKFKKMKAFFHQDSNRIKAVEDIIFKNYPFIRSQDWFTSFSTVKLFCTYRKCFALYFQSVSSNYRIWDKENVAYALEFLEILEDFRTIFLLHAFSRLFDCMTMVSSILENTFRKDNLSNTQMDKLLAFLKASQEDGFEEIWNQVKNDIFMEMPRMKKRKVNWWNKKNVIPEKLNEELDIEDVEEYRELYNKIVRSTITLVNFLTEDLQKLNFGCIFKQVGTRCEMPELPAAYCHYFNAKHARAEFMRELNGYLYSSEELKYSNFKILKCVLRRCKKKKSNHMKLTQFILTLPVKPGHRNYEKKFQDVDLWSYDIPDLCTVCGDISFPCVERNLLLDLEKSDTFHGKLVHEFCEINQTFTSC